MSELLHKFKQYLLSGVSHMIPVIAAGGILLALAFTFVPMGANGPDFANAAPIWKHIADVGGAAFTMICPVLAAYIAYGMADRPGLAAGFVGGCLANTAYPVVLEGAAEPTMIKAGFLGAIIAGFLAGFVVQLIKKIRIPAWLRPVMPILVIPVLSCLAVGLAMQLLLGQNLAEFSGHMIAFLKAMSTGNKALLAVIVGAMIAFDMGGPVNKMAMTFSMTLMAQNEFWVMGPIAAAICIPPLGLGLATLAGRRFFDESERGSGIAALTMGSMGITEGAIPFAVADPLRIIPAIMLGSITGSLVCMLGGVTDKAPHGGLVVLPVTAPQGTFLLGILAGSCVVAALAILFRWYDARKAKAAA